MESNGGAEDDVSAGAGTPGGDSHSPAGTAFAGTADVETWKARKAYPSTLFAGGPVFGIARERPRGGWQVHPHFSGLAPQDARDRLGAEFRVLAAQATEAGDRERAAHYSAAAERLDWEALDELTVAGERYRVVRAERFIRMGPDGPEPPRGTDPDRVHPAEPPLDPADGLVIDPARDDLAPGVLRVELLTALRRNGTVPRDVREDSHVAARTHPGGVLLPATFMAAEREGGRWRPQSTGTAPTPRDARDTLGVHLRIMVPWQQDLTDAEHDLFKRAADRLDTEQLNEIDVAGRHFAIIRVERLVRIGPDGPEGPRRSDADPMPPAMVQERHLHDEEPESEEADERALKFIALYEEERRRRESQREGLQH